MKLRYLFSSLALLFIPFVSYAATVSPSILEVKGSKGEEIQTTFTVINSSASDQNYFLGTMNFVPKEESGSPQFVPQKDTSGLVQWINLPFNQVLVKAHAKAEIPFKILLPQEATPGGYYASVTVSSTPTDVVNANGAVVEAKTAVLVFLTVSGEAKEQVAFLDLKAPRLVTSLYGASIKYRLQNQGNTIVKPDGEIEWKDVFGRVLEKQNANQAGSRVLPMTTRTFDVLMQDKNTSFYQSLIDQVRILWVGPTWVRLSLQTESGFKINEQTLVWYLPWQLSVSILLVVIVVFGGYRLLAKRNNN